MTTTLSPVPLMLALECSSVSGSLCLYDGVSAIASHQWEGGTRSGHLFEALEQVRHQLPQVGVIAVGTGPGSYTGIRISVAAADAIRLAQNVRWMGVCSADAVASELVSEARLGVFADARRGECYVAYYRHGVPEGGVSLIPAAAVSEAVGGCTLAVSAEPMAGVQTRAVPTAQAVARLAWERWSACQVGDDTVEPIYLRPPSF